MSHFLSALYIQFKKLLFSRHSLCHRQLKGNETQVTEWMWMGENTRAV